MPVFSQSRLMRESEWCLEDAAYSGDELEQMVAQRILGDVHQWQQWEVGHLALVRSVAGQVRADAQSTALRSGAIGLIHRKALFEYLRATGLRGTARRRIVRYFRGALQYTDAMVSEHGAYLRSAGSHLCVHHLGVSVLLDGVFQAPIKRYELLYTEYFHAFCDNLLAGVDGRPQATQKSLLPMLKHEVSRLHASILALPRSAPDLDYEALMRRPTGDTVRLKRLRLQDDE